MSGLTENLPHTASAPADARTRTISSGPAEAEAGSDGELIAACERFLRAEAEYRRRVDAGADASDDPALDQFQMDEYYPAAEAVCEIPARTPAGVRAKAEAALAFYDPDPPDRGSLMEDALWEILCWLAGRPCAVAEIAPDHSMPADSRLIDACIALERTQDRPVSSRHRHKGDNLLGQKLRARSDSAMAERGLQDAEQRT